MTGKPYRPRGPIQPIEGECGTNITWRDLLGTAAFLVGFVALGYFWGQVASTL